MSLAKTWTMPARRPGARGAEVGQPAVVGLHAGPTPLVVLGRRRQRDQVPLAEERGHRVGEQHLGRDAVGFGLGQASVAVPVAVGDRRQQVGERIDVLGGPGVELVVPAVGQVRPVVLDVASGVAVGRNRRCSGRTRARWPSSTQRRRRQLSRLRSRRPGGAALRRLLEPVADDEVTPLDALHAETAELPRSMMSTVRPAASSCALNSSKVVPGAGGRGRCAATLRAGCAGPSTGRYRAGPPEG